MEIVVVLTSAGNMFEDGSERVLSPDTRKRREDFRLFGLNSDAGAIVCCLGEGWFVYLPRSSDDFASDSPPGNSMFCSVDDDTLQDSQEAELFAFVFISGSSLTREIGSYGLGVLSLAPALRMTLAPRRDCRNAAVPL